ncbi:hypothetical protein AVEN_272821-1 [Araneus ventricosus]|uniref:CCHC-type domain-containing protein n=1 Tax=Araneus ventricosus TaxID=182803 RepID=A0A4Y2SXW4_ARAVE|nr:hypothetical protein AVEN_272821-1 [Araneus ventricosus]
MSTAETFHEISPFLVHKLILSTIGEVKNIKKLKSGDLLLEVSNTSQATTISKLTTLGNLNVKVSAHKNLNCSRGVISERGLKKHTESQLVQELSNQKVCGARRIQIKRDGKLIPTQHLILTFSAPELPKSIKAGYLSCPIKPYIANPIRCFKCQKFGHSQQASRSNSKICAQCCVAGHDSSDCISDEIKCRNCEGDYPAFSKSCPLWILEKEIQATKNPRNISHLRASWTLLLLPNQELCIHHCQSEQPTNHNLLSTMCSLRIPARILIIYEQNFSPACSINENYTIANSHGAKRTISIVREELRSFFLTLKYLPKEQNSRL